MCPNIPTWPQNGQAPVTAGFSSPAVIFATAVIALPIAGALWVAAGLTIQHYNIEPQIKEADKRLGEARALAQLSPDVERAFDAFVYANSEVEADRRFRKWQVYIENLETKVSHFFAKHVNQSSYIKDILTIWHPTRGPSWP